MWIHNILNAIFLFISRLLELLGILFSILIIPFSILAAANLNVKDAVAYSRYIIHQRLNSLRTFSFTIKVSVDNNIPQFCLQHYDDDAADATKEISEMNFPSVRACILRAFQEARRYSYVIFQTDGASSKFIQLRMDTGIYVVDFPLTARTLNRDYAVDFIKMLRSRGYTKTAPATYYRDKTYCIETKNPDMTIINANIGRNPERAADFCSMIFTKLFKTTAIPEVIVG